MARVISNEEVKDINEKLLSMPKPEKKRYTRKEAVGVWKSTIQKRIEDGWDFEDIAAAIREASGGSVNYRPKDLEELFLKYQAPIKMPRRKKETKPLEDPLGELADSLITGEIDKDVEKTC